MKRILVLSFLLLSYTVGTQIASANGISTGFLPDAVAVGAAVTADLTIDGGPWHVENMAPGVWVESFGVFTVSTPGTEDNKAIGTGYRIYTEMVSESVPGFCDHILVRLEKRENSSWVLHFEGPLRKLAASGYLDIGESHEWRLSAKITEETGNGFQGAQCSYKLVVESTAGGPSALGALGRFFTRVFLPIVIRQH